MFSQTSTDRASRGSVSIINSHERLQLRFRYEGKRYYISTGLTDTPSNRKLAETKASEIEQDILCKELDLTLQKYQPHSVLSTITSITPIKKPKPDLDELWEKYSEFKKPQVSPSTFAKDFTKKLGLKPRPSRTAFLPEVYQSSLQLTESLFCVFAWQPF